MLPPIYYSTVQYTIGNNPFSATEYEEFHCLPCTVPVPCSMFHVPACQLHLCATIAQTPGPCLSFISILYFIRSKSTRCYGLNYLTEVNAQTTHYYRLNGEEGLAAVWAILNQLPLHGSSTDSQNQRQMRRRPICWLLPTPRQSGTPR